MSTELSAPEIVRKRSRSSSPNDANSPTAAKKANIDSSAPASLPELSLPSTSEDDSQPLPAVDAPTEHSVDQTMTDADHELPTKPVVEAVTLSAEEVASADAAAAAASTIQMRALIVTQDASIIIGKAGKNVNEIRDKSGSKITITEAVPGNPERVMVVAGQLDAVSKVSSTLLALCNGSDLTFCNRLSVSSFVGSTMSPLTFPQFLARERSRFGQS